jgi:hypothetical protein
MRQALATGAAVLIVAREELEQQLLGLLPDTRDIHVVHFSPGSKEKLSRQVLSILLT